MNPSPEKNDKKQRIALVIAQAGTCSRREAEAWIRAGRVSVNETPLETPAYCVSPQDHITVDGQPLPHTADHLIRLWVYHKPRGLITTHKDPQERPTVFQNLPKTLPRVVSIGRLDLNSEGLLLLTTSGSVARFFEHPQTGLPRVYRVRIRGSLKGSMIHQLEQGITIGQIAYKPIQVRLLKDGKEPARSTNQWIDLILWEGKNREIRTILTHLGVSINRLMRVEYGPFSLDHLSPGEIKEIETKKLYNILKDLGYEPSDVKMEQGITSHPTKF